VAELDSSPKSLQTLYGWYGEQTLWVNRRYQRKLVWTLKEKQKLIESVLQRYPIPAILLAEREDGYEVIDGLQRLHTFMSFIETGFPTEDERYFNVAEFPTANSRATEGVFPVASTASLLTAKEVGTFLDYSMAISIMRGATEAQIDEVFGRINTYGHRLSDQERRQAGVQNSFSGLVRELSSSIRGDVSEDVLRLAEMPLISIDLPMARHGYQVAAAGVFWVSQGILRSTDLRDSMDEQCVADIAASIVGGSMLPRSKDALDNVYESNSSERERIEAALVSYGVDKFAAEFKFIIDQIRLIADETRLRALLFSRTNTNPFPAMFAVLFVALHELLVAETKQIGDLAGARTALTGLDRRVDTSRGSATPAERRANIDTIKGLLSPHLVAAQHRDLYGDQTATDIDDAIRRSEIEAPHYELKQGILRLDSTKSIDPNILDKFVHTICGIANNGRGRSGSLLLGVADKKSDAERVESIYSVTARAVGRKYVVGVKREAVALGESMDLYFGRLKTHIQNSGLSEPLKSGVLASLTFCDYFGLGIVVINVPPQGEVSTVDGRVFVRSGESTEEVTAAEDIVAVARRF